MDERSPEAEAATHAPPSPAGGRRPRARRALLLALKVVAVLLPTAILLAIAAELAARRYLEGTYGFLAPDPVLGWAYVPGREADAITDREDGMRKTRIRINSAGFRDREFAPTKAPGSRRIAIIGDSFVEALQVAEEDMFARLLEERLRASGTECETIAAGNGNYGIDQSLLFYRERVRPLRPDAVVFVFFPFNDLSDNVPELNDRAYMPKRFFSLEGGALRGPGEPTMPRATVALQDMRGPVVEFLQPRCMAFNLGNSWMRSYAPGIAETLESAGLAMPDGLEDDAGVPLLYGLLREPPRAEWREAAALGSALLDRMRGDVEADGASFHVALMPFGEHLFATNPGWVKRCAPLGEPGMRPDGAERVGRAICEELNLDTLDLTPVFLDAVAKDGVPVNIMPNGHLNEHGHEVVAEALAEFLAPRLAPSAASVGQ